MVFKLSYLAYYLFWWQGFSSEQFIHYNSFITKAIKGTDGKIKSARE
jgi:hypothetical protein